MSFFMLPGAPQKISQQTALSVYCINKSATPGCMFRFSVLFSARALDLSERGRMRSHPSPANSHQSGPMLEPQREEAIAHSTGPHSPSTQGGQGHLTHRGPVYFSLLSCAPVCTILYASVMAHTRACVYVNACTVISTVFYFPLFALVGSSLHRACR